MTSEGSATRDSCLADRPLRRRSRIMVGFVAAAAILLSLVGGIVMYSGTHADRGARPGTTPGQAVQLPTGRTARTAIVDAETPLADEAAVRAHLASLPKAKAFLGTPVDQVPELADVARRVIMTAPAFRSGITPGVCLDSVEQAGLVAHVESVTYQQQLALAYVIASASSGASKLDQIQVFLLDPRTCAERLFL